MIGGFRSVLCVSVLQGSLLVIVIMIDGSEKRNCECRGGRKGGPKTAIVSWLLNFGIRMFVKSAVKHDQQRFIKSKL